MKRLKKNIFALSVVSLVSLPVLLPLGLVSFVVFECVTWGGYWVYDIALWEPADGLEKVEGSFTPMIKFGIDGKEITIIPLVLRKSSTRPANSIGVRRKDGSRYGYDRFEYVRFTRFEVHYESGGVQKLIKANAPIKERRFKVSSGPYYELLFRFDLDLIEKCTVIVEGYSKLIEGDHEEFFRLTKGYRTTRTKSICTGRNRLGSV